MDQKQKEQLRILLKARKRADKVLAQRRAVEREKQDRNKRLEANQALVQQYTQELTALAQESGILAMAEQAALLRGGRLTQEVSCYIYYGLSGSSFQNALGVANRGELRASHLAIRITWEDENALREVEIRVHKAGQITFHNSFLPVFPFIWRWDSQLLQHMLASALKHPRPPSVTAKSNAFHNHQ